MPDTPQSPNEILNAVRTNAKLFRQIGWVLLFLGLVSILFPYASSVAFKALLGWLFLLTGAATLYHAFQAREWRSAIFAGAIGVLHLAAGVYLAFFLNTGLIGLTMLMALLFLIQGGFETAMALQHRQTPGWAGLLISGVAAIALGVLLLLGLPGSALWAIGLMMGINLLTSGMSFQLLAHAAETKT